jgi:hypothetical protein
MPQREKLIVFTHIDKTAGTSFVDELIRPNLPAERIWVCTGVKSFLRGLLKNSLFITGHTPFGLHVFTRRRTEYITFLREPIDRATSHYYFARESKEAHQLTHPLRNLANSVDIVEFYRRRHVQNLQTRFLAGHLAFYLYPYLKAAWFDRLLLKMAIANLEQRYVCFGLQERYRESLGLFRHRFGWQAMERVEPRMKTSHRMQVADLTTSTRAALHEANALDIALYRVATQLFCERLAEHII